MIYPWCTFSLVAFFVGFVLKIINGTFFVKGLLEELKIIFFLGALVLYQIYFFKAVGYKRRQ